MNLDKDILNVLKQANDNYHFKRNLYNTTEVLRIFENKSIIIWEDIVKLANINKAWNASMTKYALATLIYALENNIYHDEFIDKLQGDLDILKVFILQPYTKYDEIFVPNYNEVRFVKINKRYRLILIKPNCEEFTQIFLDYLTESINVKYTLVHTISSDFSVSIGNINIQSYRDINDNVFWAQINYFKKIYKNNDQKKKRAIKNVCHFYRWLLSRYPEFDFFGESLTLSNELLQSTILVTNIFKNAYFTTLGIDEDLDDKPIICFILKNYDSYSTRVNKISHITLDLSKIETPYYRTIFIKYIQSLTTVSDLTSNGRIRAVVRVLHFIEQLKNQSDYPNKDIRKLNTPEAILIRKYLSNNVNDILLCSANNNLGANRRFFQWCYDNNYISFDDTFFDYFSQYEEPNKYHGKAIPDEDIAKISNKFIELSKDNEEYLVYYAIFLILLETEFRISQVCGLTINSIQSSLKDDQFYIYSNTKVTNGKKIQQPICLSTKNILTKVIRITETLRNEAVQTSAQGKIFLHRTVNKAVVPINQNVFLNKFQQICEIARVDKYNSRNLRDTHMTKAFEFITKEGKSDLEMQLLSKHSIIDTTKQHYIEIELTKMLESIYQTTLGNRDVTIQKKIVENLPDKLSSKDSEVEHGCGHCNAESCQTIGNLPCLMCEHFVTTPKHKPYFIKMINNCDSLITKSTITHEKEDIKLIKELCVNWLREIYIVEEKKC